MGITRPLQAFWGFLQFWYLQWELNTSLYMLEPAEKAIIHTIAIAIFSIIIYAAWTYLSSHVIMVVEFLEALKTEEQVK